MIQWVSNLWATNLWAFFLIFKDTQLMGLQLISHFWDTKDVKVMIIVYFCLIFWPITQFPVQNCPIMLNCTKIWIKIGRFYPRFMKFSIFRGLFNQIIDITNLWALSNLWASRVSKFFQKNPLYNLRSRHEIHVDSIYQILLQRFGGVGDRKYALSCETNFIKRWWNTRNDQKMESR